MSGCSLPTNCGAEDVIPSYFPVENQTNPFVPRFAFHRDGRGGLKKCSSLHGEWASVRTKKWASTRNCCQASLIVIATPIAEIDL
jgi:hypothetical protein